MMDSSKYVKRIRSAPHWRVLIRPSRFKSNAVASNAEAWRLIENSTVILRGWDYPAVSNKVDERENGENWIGCGTDFLGHLEYWRFYRSAQFIHLFQIHETTGHWRDTILQQAHWNLGRRWLSDDQIDKSPGFINVTNFLYIVTEIFEFAARIASSGVWEKSVSIDVTLRKVSGFALVASTDRAPLHLYRYDSDSLTISEWFNVSDLLGAASKLALKYVVSALDRFGWSNPPLAQLQKDQSHLIAKDL